MLLNEWHSELRRRINEIKQITPKSQSRIVALVAKKWYDSLTLWIDNPCFPLPSAIDNSTLFEDGSVITSLQQGVDFEVVEEKMWDDMIKFFTGGPELKRKLSTPATPGTTSVLLSPISLEMHTKQGIKYKNCAADWKLADMKRFLCRCINVRDSDYSFYSYDHNTVSTLVDERMTVGEYNKIHGNKIKLGGRHITHRQFRGAISPSAKNKSNYLASTLPRIQQTFTDQLSRPSGISTITIRSGSCIGLQYPKPVGLINLGNTCFFNAAMQCIVRIKPLVDFFFSPNFEVAINPNNPLGSKGEIAYAFQQFLKDMSSNSQSARNPQKFRSILIKKFHTFANYGQHDSQEVVGAILDGLHEDLNQSSAALGQVIPDNEILDTWTAHISRNKSIIVDIFQGALSNSLTCPRCHHFQQVIDPFMFLSLPVLNRSYPPITLTDCIANFCKEEILDSNNYWMCPECKQMVGVTKKISVEKCPQIMIIHLKRFYGSGFFARKIDSDVKYPNELKASIFNPKEKGVYKLFGAIYHTGGMMSGHYTAATIDPPSGKWYNFNDSCATPMSEQAVHSSRAYILFYQIL